ncbi:MAG TPA: DUF6491 family protein [Chiayiivirga sp.]|nr:DUF6491 family protein [Chiayiivirga sp.]
MNIPTRIGMVAALALTLAACAGPATKPDANTVARECFSADRVSGFTPIDDTTVRLQVGPRDVYELKLMHFCPDVNWSLRIGLRTVGGSSFICAKDAKAVDIVVLDQPVSAGFDRCRVNTLRKISDAELDAEQQARDKAKAERKAARSKG